jgi:hypothetical protein
VTERSDRIRTTDLKPGDVLTFGHKHWTVISLRPATAEEIAADPNRAGYEWTIITYLDRDNTKGIEQRTWKQPTAIHKDVMRNGVVSSALSGWPTPEAEAPTYRHQIETSSDNGQTWSTVETSTTQPLDGDDPAEIAGEILGDLCADQANKVHGWIPARTATPHAELTGIGTWRVNVYIGSATTPAGTAAHQDGANQFTKSGDA